MEKRGVLKILGKAKAGIEPKRSANVTFYCTRLEILKRGPGPQLPAWVRECFVFQSDAKSQRSARW